ncbi:NitT/TauT family transport system permease protein [Pseudonocardia thermophila]|uniref:NitT/TauT family transport system permease protein n=1 Tax=Pseudonocardia thermophila TaxID=1848 RepID=A0A1M7BFX9_PSETH|nr:NitT/TauT family transport system permease protein [Pseudonocardia thermophila]
MVWHLYVVLFDVSKLVLPNPLQVGQALLDLLREPSTWSHGWTTLSEILLGFGIALVVGVGLGVLLAKLPTLENLLNPFIVATQVTPKTPLVPLLIVWFGFGVSSKVVIAAIFGFFPVFRNTLLGIKSVPGSFKDVMSVFKANRWQRFFLMEMRYAAPYIFAGTEVGVVMAVIGAIVGEFLAGDHGWGYLTVAMLNNFQIPQLFAVIILLTALGFAMHIVVAVLRRFMVRWHESAAIGSAE